MADPIPLFPKEEDRLFMAWRLAVREHGQDSKEAWRAWTDYLLWFVPEETRPFALQFMVERMGVQG